MALTPRQRRFVDALLGGATNKDAAIQAGYSEKTASAAGSRLFKHPAVAEALKKGLASRPKMTKPATKPAPAEPKDEKSPAGSSRTVADLMRLHSDPKDFLMALMNDVQEEPKLRLEAAKALMPFIHPRKGEAGKKDAAKDAAAQAAAGRFAPKGPPRLVVDNGK